MRIIPIQYRAAGCMNLIEPEKNGKQMALELFSLSKEKLQEPPESAS